MAICNSTLSISEIRKHISYNPETGEFIRLIGAGRTKSGQRVGNPTTNGYTEIQVLKTKFYAHRLAWALFFDKHPDGVVDHINGITSDNRISNLRDVSFVENNQNQREQHEGKKHLLGVRKRVNCWSATIKVSGKHVYLGSYASEGEAHAAYLREKRKIHVGCTI